MSVSTIPMKPETIPQKFDTCKQRKKYFNEVVWSCASMSCCDAGLPVRVHDCIVYLVETSLVTTYGLLNL